MTTALLQTTYFGPIQWYQKLFRHDSCLIEQYDSYQKQTYRNRCVIATANGTQALTVPIVSPATSSALCVSDGSAVGEGKCLLKDLRISDHNEWRRVHWNALQSAYSESPFFEYYADEIYPFFERKYTFLIDFNEAIRQTVCDLIDIHPKVTYTQQWVRPPLTPPHLEGEKDCATVTDQQHAITDYRDVINAKHPRVDPDFEAKEYWQVFRHKHGFLPNLSILDLLFCMGPESIYYL